MGQYECGNDGLPVVCHFTAYGRNHRGDLLFLSAALILLKIAKLRPDRTLTF